MIIWGFGGSKLTDKGAVWPATCPRCRNDVLLHHVTTHASFRLFFVPIFPYDRKHHLMCPVCRQSVQFDPKAELPRIEAAKQLLIQARAGQITEQQYMYELARLHGQAPAALPPVTAVPLGAAGAGGPIADGGPAAVTPFAPAVSVTVPAPQPGEPVDGSNH